jgi:hypothetical protein
MTAIISPTESAYSNKPKSATVAVKFERNIAEVKALILMKAKRRTNPENLEI